jgi:hypothetical protein
VIEACSFLFTLAIGGTLIALVGHGLWVVAAEVWKALFGPGPTPPRGHGPRSSPGPCAACGSRLAPGEQVCTACGLIPDSPTAGELRELEITARRLQAFRDREALDAPTCERVYKCIEDRQYELIGTRPEALPVRPGEATAAAGQEPATAKSVLVARRLDRLLRGCPDVRQLTVGNRQQAFAWYRLLTEADLPGLSALGLLGLARLLDMAGLSSRAFRIYRILLEVHPHADCAGQAALEAGLLAARANATASACWFLGQALARPLSEDARRQAEEVLRELAPSVLPAPPPPAEEVAPALPVAEVAEVAAAVPGPPTPAPEPTPGLPRRTLGQLLAAFMEERNILWGELVGGLLIVGCSIALVISLWQTLEQIPYFPFLIFAAITVALFGAGLYTLSHWKLESTSRGLLVIGTLLVPLNFFILAGLYRGTAKGFVDLATEAGALAAFSGLVLIGARSLLGKTLPSIVGRADRLLTLAVMGPCAVQLFIPRVLDVQPPLPWLDLLLPLAAVLCYGFALAPVLGAAGRRESLDGRLAGNLLLLFGLATFALAAALGFYIYRSDAVQTALQRLAVPVALAGVPVLAAGLLLHRMVTAPVQPAEESDAAAEAEPRRGLAPGVARTIGTGVALGGALVLLLALGFAWPVPLALLIVSGLNVAVLEVAAARGRLPLLLVPALVCLAVGYLVGLHLLHGNLGLTRADQGALFPALAVSPLTGSGLVVLVIGLAAAGEWLAAAGRRSAGVFHAAGAGMLALFSMTAVAAEGMATPERGAVVFGAYTATALAVNVRWRWVLLTYAGSALLLIGLVYGVQALDPGLSWPSLLLIALLAEATVALAGSLALQREPEAPAESTGPAVVHLFAIPFRWAALASSFLAAVLIPFAAGWDWLTPAAAATAWLAALWLIMAWSERRPGLFAAFQAALTLALLFATTAWLRGQPWFEDDPWALLDPRSLHAYGIALGLLALLWMVARVSLGARPAARVLFDPPWPAVDWLVLNALVTTQLVLALRAVVPAVIGELTPFLPAAAPDPVRTLLVGPAAWAWLGVLLVVLALALWERHPHETRFGLIVSAVTACTLGAGLFIEGRAAHYALRWGLAACYLGGSALLWLRGPLGRLAERLGILPEKSAHIAAYARVLLLALTAVPVLGLIFVIAVLGFAGLPHVAPLEGSLFAEAGRVTSQVVPLALVSLALAGHGAREASAGHAFAGGLVAVITLAGGYALGVVTAGGVLDAGQWVRILQVAAAGAAAWLLLWLGLWQRLVPQDTEERPGQWTRMLTGQAWLAGVALGIMLVTAVAWLTLAGPVAAGAGARYPPPSPWTVEAGSALGWLALLLVVAGGGILGRQQTGNVGAHGLGLTGLATAALLACSVERQWPGWGYRVLMIGWAGFAVAWAAVPAGEDGTSAGAPERATKTVVLGLTGVLVLVLALGAAVGYHDHLWAAGTVGLIALGSAVLGVRWRREAWAFAAAGALVLAASLVVWRANREAALALWWVHLLQAQLITAATSAVVWLRLRERIYPDGLDRVSSSPLLAVLVAVCFLGNALLLTAGLVPLLLVPAGPLPLFVGQAGHLAGWLALLPTLAALLGYTRRAAPGVVVHALAAGGLLAGAVAACSAHLLAGPGSWFAQHVLTSAWSVLGLLLLAASWAGNGLPALGPAFWPPERRARAAALLAAMFPIWPSRRWVEGISLLVVLLALRGAWGDPIRPYWSAAATLTVSALLGALALWSRRVLHVYASGALIAVVSFLLWKAWVADRIEHMPGVPAAQELFATFVYAQAIGLAVASVLWSLIDQGLARRSPPVDLRAGLLPFCHAASLLAVHLLALLALGGLVSDLLVIEVEVARPLGWVALAAVVAALAVALWDPRAADWGVPLAPLYLAGLGGIGLALHGASLPPARLCEAGSLALAGYVLSTSALAAFDWARVSTRLRIPEPHGGWPATWFVPAQGLLTGFVAGVSVRACVAFPAAADRLTGPLAVAFLLLATLLLARRWAVISAGSGLANLGNLPRYVALALAALAAGQATWATVDPAGPAPWLDRTGLVTVTLTLLGLVLTSAPAGVFRRLPQWGQCARRFSPVLFGLACAALAALLVQEFVHYDPAPAVRSTPLSSFAVWAVAPAVVALMGVGIRWAVAPQHDPLGLRPARLSLYVYGAEILLVVLVLHLRLNVLAVLLQRLGSGWTLAVMAVAFAGVGLGELFRRRGLTVLAEPLQRTGLFLPLLPLLAFLVQPLLQIDAGAAAAPGLGALQHFLDRLAGRYGLHALVWFLLGGLYLFAALTRRSSAFGLLAALAANFGLWVLLAHYEPLAFLVHPQVWLIPVALIVLTAEHINRDRLTRAQGLGLRYLGLLLLYVSSTADMFIAGLGNSVLLPVLLALLSVLGVLAGIVLRVRAFLFLGVTFLFLVIFAQIWHAAVDRAQTWVWWTSGIVLGAAILTLFALFEKRRNDVLRMIEEIKRWE